MSPRELKICALLHHAQNGLFAAQLHQASPKLLARGTIYTTLARLVAKGWLTTVVEMDSALQIPRPRYGLSVGGRQALREFMELMGLEFIPAVELKRPAKNTELLGVKQ